MVSCNAIHGMSVSCVRDIVVIFDQDDQGLSRFSRNDLKCKLHQDSALLFSYFVNDKIELSRVDLTFCFLSGCKPLLCLSG